MRTEVRKEQKLAKWCHLFLTHENLLLKPEVPYLTPRELLFMLRLVCVSKSANRIAAYN